METKPASETQEKPSETLYQKVGKRYRPWGVIMRHIEDMPLGKHVLDVTPGHVSMRFRVTGSTPEEMVGLVNLHQRIVDAFNEALEGTNKPISVYEMAEIIAKRLLENPKEESGPRF